MSESNVIPNPAQLRKPSRGVAVAGNSVLVFDQEGIQSYFHMALLQLCRLTPAATCQIQNTGIGATKLFFLSTRGSTLSPRFEGKGIYHRERGFSPPQSLHLGSKTPQNTNNWNKHILDALAKSSWNHRTSRVGRDPQGSSNPTQDTPGTPARVSTWLLPRRSWGQGGKTEEWDSRDPRSQR